MTAVLEADDSAVRDHREWNFAGFNHHISGRNAFNHKGLPEMENTGMSMSVCMSKGYKRDKGRCVDLTCELGSTSMMNYVD